MVKGGGCKRMEAHVCTAVAESRWGGQGAERFLKLTVSSALVISSRRRVRIFQLLRHPLAVNWVAEGWSFRGSGLSATWDVRQQNSLNKLLKAVAQALANEMLGMWVEGAAMHQVAGYCGHTHCQQHSPVGWLDRVSGCGALGGMRNRSRIGAGGCGDLLW